MEIVVWLIAALLRLWPRALKEKVDVRLGLDLMLIRWAVEWILT